MAKQSKASPQKASPPPGTLKANLMAASKANVNASAIAGRSKWQNANAAKFSTVTDPETIRKRKLKGIVG